MTAGAHYLLVLKFIRLRWNLVYPDGIFYDKDSEDYRTDSVNPALEIFSRFTKSCGVDKRKADLELLPNLPLVEYSGLEPLTSTLPVSRSSQMS